MRSEPLKARARAIRDEIAQRVAAPDDSVGRGPGDPAAPVACVDKGALGVNAALAGTPCA